MHTPSGDGAGAGPVWDVDMTADGLLRGFTAPGAPAETWSYDDDRRPIAHGVPGGPTQTAAFTPEGRTARWGTDGAQTTFAYDGPPGHATGLQRDVDGTAQDAAIGIEYDGGLVTALTTSGATSSRVEIGFDDRMRVSALTLKRGGTTVDSATIERDDRDLVTHEGPLAFERQGPLGAVSAITDAEFSRTRAYDDQRQPADRTDSAGTTQVYREQITRDRRGLVTRRVETVAGDSHTFDYAYDDAGRLTQVKRDGSGLESDGYDARGNRTSVTVGGAARSESFGAADRLTGAGYTYDDAGRLTGRGGDSFSYDASGDLVRAIVGSTTIEYAYDAFGRLVARSDGSSRREYVYGDPANFTLVTAVFDGSGAATLLRYDDGDRLVALERDGTRYMVSTDAMGTPVVVSKGDGTIVKRLEHDAYGAVLSDSAPGFELPIGFAGGLSDPDTGFVRFALRTYDPATARFTTPDPTRFAGSPRNLYAYAGGDPISRRDPTGLAAACVGASLYDGIGGGAGGCVGEDEQNPGHTAFSFCVEVGVGVGGGVEGSIQKNVESAGSKVFAEGGVALGPVGAGLGGDLSLDCFEATGKASVQAGFVSTEVNTNGEVTGKVSGGAEASVKAGIKKCWRSSW